MLIMGRVKIYWPPLVRIKYRQPNGMEMYLMTIPLLYCVILSRNVQEKLLLQIAKVIYY